MQNKQSQHLTGNWHPNGRKIYHDMACLNKKCVKIPNICDKHLLKNVWRKFVSKYRQKINSQYLTGSWHPIDTKIYGMPN